MVDGSCVSSIVGMGTELQLESHGSRTMVFKKAMHACNLKYHAHANSRFLVTTEGMGI